MEEEYVIHKESKKCYYFFFPSYNLSLNYEFAHALNMTSNEFLDIMVKNFNGYLRSKEVFFKSEEDACEAADWIESQLVLNKLLKT